MKFNRSSLSPLAIIAVLAMFLSLSGCGGSNGATGPAGPAGATGATGPAGPVGATTTGPACSVCHGPSSTIGVSVAALHPKAAADPDVFITINSLTTNASNQAVVTFTVKDAAGNGIIGVPQANTSFVLADLVKAGTTVSIPAGNPGSPSTTYSTPYFEQYINEKGSTSGNWVDNNNGTYQYTLSYAFGDAAASAAAGLNADEYNAADDQRLAINISTSNASHVYGPFTTTGATPTSYSPASGFFDFSGVPAAGVAATEIPSQRQFVVVQACEQCHSEKMDGAAHANGYRDTRFCVLCHSPLYGGDSSTAHHMKGDLVKDGRFFPSLIHQLHAGIVAKDATTNGLGQTIASSDDWSDIVFPQGYVEGGADTRDTTNAIALGGITESIANCSVCHSVPSTVPTTASTTISATTPPQYYPRTVEGNTSGLDNWKNAPSAQICGTCHTAANFATGTGHPGGIQADTACATCHAPVVSTSFSYSVTAAHDLTQRSDYVAANDMNTPEFDVNLAVTDANGKAITDATSVYATNGGYFKPGDSFNVTATLKNHYTGAAVDPSIYTTAQDAAYAAGGGLHVASLYVYGPRSNVVPLLTDGGAYKQGLNLFAGTAAIDDATVTTSASGFSATVTVPTGATSGTYMIRTRFGDYDYNRSDPTGGGTHKYQLESFALDHIQIGTAKVQAKVDGDTCTNCHGGTLMHTDDHAAPFDTDQCTACHDKSGGHADFIGNRVHAIHSHNSTGDLVNYTNGVYTTANPPSRDWADINFPLGDINPATVAANGTQPSSKECFICHSSGNTSFQTNPYGSVCMGCHGDNDGAVSHMELEGFQFP